MRFFLAMWVILHHLVGKGMMLGVWSESLYPPLRMFLAQGHVAVRTFFVLSGFVLAQGYACSRWRQRDVISYGVARFARVYPIYLVSLLVISYFLLEFVLSPEFGAGLKAETVANYVLVLQGWMSQPGAGWNTPAWSLSCEFFFYLCLPPVLLWLGPRSRWKLIALTFTALVLPIVLRRVGVPSTWKPVMHFGDFLVGIAVARIYGLLRGSENWRSRRGQWLYGPAIVLGILVVTFPSTLERITDLGTVLRPLNGMLVLGLALGGGPLVRFLSTTSAQYLGQASYSMYILHVPLLWWYGSPEIFLRGYIGAGVAVIYIVGMILVSTACFEWIEKPWNRRIRDFARKRADL